MMTNEPIRLHQLLSDWLDQANIGWKISKRGETNLIEKSDDPDWHYYIGDDYTSTYPSCGPCGGSGKLMAADPEFFTKLETFLDHVSNCLYCGLTKDMDKMMIESMMKDVYRSIDSCFTQLKTIKVANTYAFPPIQYSTIKINTDP